MTKVNDILLLIMGFLAVIGLITVFNWISPCYDSCWVPTYAEYNK
jgi:hypothetical protein